MHPKPGITIPQSVIRRILGPCTIKHNLKFSAKFKWSSLPSAGNTSFGHDNFYSRPFQYILGIWWESNIDLEWLLINATFLLLIVVSNDARGKFYFLNRQPERQKIDTLTSRQTDRQTDIRKNDQLLNTTGSRSKAGIKSTSQMLIIRTYQISQRPNGQRKKHIYSIRTWCDWANHDVHVP